MNSRSFVNFVILMLHKHKSRHIPTFIISSILVFLLSSTLFINSSISQDILSNLSNESDFIVQKTNGSVDEGWIEKIEKIRGTNDIQGRVYGRYFIPNSNFYVNILGVDLFDEPNQNLKSTLNINIKNFTKEESMIISPSFKDYLFKHYYKDSYHFFTPKGEELDLKIFKTIDENSSLSSSDLAIMPISLARKILGLSEDSYTDIVLNVPNDSEKDMVGEKLKALFYGSRIIDKRDLTQEYRKFFEFKSSIFLLGFILALLTFMLILYQRFTLANSIEKRDIAILRMSGWRVNDVIKLKLFESLFIGISAFLIGVIVAYLFVFKLDAPLLGHIFTGFGNLPKTYHFFPYIDKILLFEIFIFFIVPFILSLLIPIWRVAVTNPIEAMK